MLTLHEITQKINTNGNTIVRAFISGIDCHVDLNGNGRVETIDLDDRTVDELESWLIGQGWRVTPSLSRGLWNARKLEQELPFDGRPVAGNSWGGAAARYGLQVDW